MLSMVHWVLATIIDLDEAGAGAARAVEQERAARKSWLRENCMVAVYNKQVTVFQVWEEAVWMMLPESNGGWLN